MGEEMQKLQQGVAAHQTAFKERTRTGDEALSRVSQALDDKFSSVRASAREMQRPVKLDKLERQILELDDDLARLQDADSDADSDDEDAAGAVPVLEEFRPYDYGREREVLARAEAWLRADAPLAEERLDRVWLDQGNMRERLDAAARPPDTRVMNEELLQLGVAAATSAHRKTGVRLVKESTRETRAALSAMEEDMKKLAKTARRVARPMREDPRSSTSSARRPEDRSSK
ncbi:hypothetical protein CALCODRAFT_17309 [Calocera cornea HHB12733]|uniref:Uncharacterized protein n=1 Tax=Calocera cornea HHB12733 TaxID=1353952 RepID=A0A165E7T8_9BASI|nr:hypothetical protein CALCODRAFT_17309 [Calocera cornea HHB12733]